MHVIAFDFETRADVDITKAGSYVYIHSSRFQPLLLSYSIDDNDIQTVDFTKDPIDDAFLHLWEAYLWNPEYLKTAYNVAFEREVWQTIFAQSTMHPEADAFRSPISEWEDDQVLAAYAGLPRRLADAGPALGLPADKQKLKIGSDLIRFFCVPYKGTFRDPAKYPEKWQQFIEYNRQDVLTEKEIRRRLIDSFGLPKRESIMWQIDQKINDRGIMIDLSLANQAIKMANDEREKLLEEAKDISHLDNPNSVAQLKNFLELEEDQTLRKADVAAMLGTVEDKDKRRILEIRSELCRSSVKKYEAMVRSACPDGRVRGSILFYGAQRTGRFAGRLIQPQNYPQNHLPDKDLDYARTLVKEGDSESIQMFYGSINDTLSQLTRTALVPKEGCTFVVADFSAIEARVLAWESGERWVSDAFANGEDIYCRTASEMFGVPVVKNGINGELRQKGKVAVLACGYAGSVGALKAMGADKMGLSDEELQIIVDKWRTANSHTVKFWYAINDAVWSVMKGIHNYTKVGCLMFSRKILAGIPVLVMTLPSGRSLFYHDPQTGTNRFGGESLTYMGMEAGKWSRLETYYGKLTENATQAIARDCLCVMLYRLEKKGYRTVCHIHDEAIVEVETNKAEQCLKDMLEIMSEPISWAPDLKLKGAGYITPYYRKD